MIIYLISLIIILGWSNGGHYMPVLAAGIDGEGRDKITIVCNNRYESLSEFYKVEDQKFEPVSINRYFQVRIKLDNLET